MLAILAMLAPKWALRVAPGGSAPPFPYAPLHGPSASGRDGKAGASAELESMVGVMTVFVLDVKKGTFARCGIRGHFGVALTAGGGDRNAAGKHAG